MTNNKISFDVDIDDLLGLKDGKTLEYDINLIAEKGYEEYLKQQEEHENKKREFMQLFKENFQEIVNLFDSDPKQQIAVNCSGCKFSNRTELGYGRMTTKRSKTNGYKE